MDEEAQIACLMRDFPSLDHMLCETLLRSDKHFIEQLLSSSHDPKAEAEQVKTIPITVEDPE